MSETRIVQLPADWWIAEDHTRPCIWAPGPTPFPGHPVRILRSDQVMAPLWRLLADALPDRGRCPACTATPCTSCDGEGR